MGFFFLFFLSPFLSLSLPVFAQRRHFYTRKYRVILSYKTSDRGGVDPARIDQKRRALFFSLRGGVFFIYYSYPYFVYTLCTIYTLYYYYFFLFIFCVLSISPRIRLYVQTTRGPVRRRSIKRHLNVVYAHHPRINDKK